MPSLAAFLRSVKFKKSPSETESLLQNPPAKRRSCPLAPQVRLQRTNSATGPESFNMFRRKVNPNSARPDNPDILEVPETPGERDVEKESKIQHLQQNFSSQSQPITNDLLELHVDPPKSLHPISDAPNISTISRDTITGESTSNISSQSPLSLSTSPIRESHSPHATNHKPPFLTLPSPNESFDTFNVNIDFTKFETANIEVVTHHESPSPKLITNHDFLFLVDDPPGINRRAWDAVCEIVIGVANRLTPIAAKDTPKISDIPQDTPTISIRFINSPRFIVHIQNLNQISNLFNCVTRDVPKYINRQAHPVQKLVPAYIPPLRTLEYYFWNVYNERLQKNTWIGQKPTTIILFVSSPLGNRPDDMDLFIARCADKLNANQIPLPLVSIMVVQCNTDPVVHRQLVDTRRMITWEWYTPRGKPSSLTPAGGNRMTPVRGSMLIQDIPEQKRRRPQRDWVDIITCGDLERVGGISAIEGVIEDEIRRGLHRRKKFQKEVAMNYLTHLGKENSSQMRQDAARFNDNDNLQYELPNSDELWSAGKFRGPTERQTEIEYVHDAYPDRAASSLVVVNNGRIDYYD